MNVILACPAPKGSRTGNRVTAERWGKLLRESGHRASIVDEWEGQSGDLLVALHARKSHPSARRWRRQRPGHPLIVAMTGTDLYHDLPKSAAALQSIAWADRIVILHPLAVQALPTSAHAKTRVIFQSVEPISPRPMTRKGTFDICVLGHLRHVKDPLRTAYALRLIRGLPQLRVYQAGAATSEGWAAHARSAMAKDPRYRWLGEIPRGKALKLLAGSRLMVISSRMEGGANVVGEATVNGVPILASRVPGNLGLLATNHPGTFPVGDTQGLADLLLRTATDPLFMQQLAECGNVARPWFERERERHSWEMLLGECTVPLT